MSNTDDHLRNFGFLMDEDFKIYLSPFFDLSSIYSKEKIHALSIDGSFNNGNNLKLDNFINISKYFDISKDEALTIIKFIVNTIKDNLSLVFKNINLIIVKKNIYYLLLIMRCLENKYKG